jgi:hypothetical protein
VSITLLPTPPSRQDPTNFAQDADEFLGSLPTFAEEANELAATINSQATQVVTLYNSFDDRYLGAKDTAPTLDNDGNALIGGALYWNTSNTQMWVWTGTSWAALATMFAATQAQQFAAAAEQEKILASEYSASAEQAKLAAEDILDNFDARYLGAKSSAPTTDNDGNTLLVGALYWNTTTPAMNIWTGTNWSNVIAGVSSFNSRIGAVALTTEDITNILGTEILYAVSKNGEFVDTILGALDTVEHNFANAAIWSHTGADNFVPNFINVPTTNDNAITVTLILNQTTGTFVPTSIQINSEPVIVNWINGEIPAGGALSKDVVSFTFIRTNSNWTALGSVSSYKAL